MAGRVARPTQPTTTTIHLDLDRQDDYATPETQGTFAVCASLLTPSPPSGDSSCLHSGPLALETPSARLLLL